MKLNYDHVAFIAIMMFSSFASNAQMASTKEKSNSDKAPELKMYVIRREIPNAGKLSLDELKTIAQTSCAVIKEIGSRIEWQHSYVTGNNIFCVYKADNENTIREHARKGGFPATEIFEVMTIISPATATLPVQNAGKN